MARGLTAGPDVHEVMRAPGDAGWAIQAPLDSDGGTWAERQAPVQVLQEQCRASAEPIRHPMGQGMASCAPGLFVGG
jgi:hypothetical protein